MDGRTNQRRLPDERLADEATARGSITAQGRHGRIGLSAVDRRGETETVMAEACFAGVDVESRPYQLRIVRAAREMLLGRFVGRAGAVEPAAHSVLIESPTGSGKTVIGLEIARQLHRQLDFSVGWVSMRRNLLLQAAAENTGRRFDVPLELISMFDKQPPKVDLLIVDEAQHDGAMSMANLHCMIRPRMVVGLTATPFRTDRIQLCFDKVIKDAGIHQLIQDGYLSRYHHYTIPEYSPEAVGETYLRQPEHWGQTLIFFHRRVQCQACLDLLRRRGVAAELVTAQTDRQRQIADFASGRLQVLLNMAILTEGFDCPQLKTVFCRPSGRACTIQMAGRVFRRCPELPFKQIVQCKRTRHPMVKTALADEQYVWSGRRWAGLTLNRNINEITMRARQAIARSTPQLPEYLARNRPARQRESAQRWVSADPS